MRQTITHAQAVAQLLADDFANWTHEGAKELVTYLEEWEADIGVSLDFDPVEVRCVWSEYASAEEALKQYDMDSLDELDSWTTVIVLDNGGVLVEQF